MVRTKLPKFTFIDLFAGIGAFRIAGERAGGRCVFSCDVDKFARKTYFENFKDMPASDIQQIDAKDIPDHDVLMAGFPCQPFSIAGVSTNNFLNREHGFKHATRGNLFFDIIRIVKTKAPGILILENVENLKSHNGGETFKIIYGMIEEQGYKIFHKVVSSEKYSLQKRKRIFIVCVKKSMYGNDVNYSFPQKEKSLPKVLGSILEESPGEVYTLKDKTWEYLQNHKAKHSKKGNGFGYGLVSPGAAHTRTITARYYKDGSEILIDQGDNKNPRKLTPREAARLMGFPDSFKIVVSNTQAYKQFGNSIILPVVSDVVQTVVSQLIKP